MGWIARLKAPFIQVGLLILKKTKSCWADALFEWLVNGKLLDFLKFIQSNFGPIIQIQTKTYTFVPECL